MMTKDDVSVTYENNIFYCIKDNTKWVSIDGENWYGEERRIKELEKELENERKLNAEIKARFVKCNTCTPDMKEKCLMFNENLCEGERCEELVDLMALVNDSGDKVKIAKSKEVIKNLIDCFFYLFEHDDKARGRTKINDAIEQARQFLEEE